MSSIHESLSRLVDTARQLRDMAGELGNLELKSTIVDEISTLQEIHDALARSSATGSREARITPRGTLRGARGPFMSESVG